MSNVIQTCGCCGSADIEGENCMACDAFLADGCECGGPLDAPVWVAENCESPRCSYCLEEYAEAEAEAKEAFEQELAEYIARRAEFVKVAERIAALPTVESLCIEQAQTGTIYMTLRRVRDGEEFKLRIADHGKPYRWGDGCFDRAEQYDRIRVEVVWS